jgi:hypothetical protein
MLPLFCEQLKTANVVLVQKSFDAVNKVKQFFCLLAFSLHNILSESFAIFVVYLLHGVASVPIPASLLPS